MLKPEKQERILKRNPQSHSIPGKFAFAIIPPRPPLNLQNKNKSARDRCLYYTPAAPERLRRIASIHNLAPLFCWTKASAFLKQSLRPLVFGFRSRLPIRRVSASLSAKTRLRRSLNSALHAQFLFSRGCSCGSYIGSRKAARGDCCSMGCCGATRFYFMVYSHRDENDWRLWRNDGRWLLGDWYGYCWFYINLCLVGFINFPLPFAAVSKLDVSLHIYIGTILRATHHC